MPFVSQAQRGFMYSQHPDIAKRWEKETPKKKLPMHKPKQSKKTNPVLSAAGKKGVMKKKLTKIMAGRK